MIHLQHFRKLLLPLLFIFASSPLLAQSAEENTDDEQQISKKYNKAFDQWVSGNISAFGHRKELSVPDWFQSLSDLQRTMHRSEPLAPDLEYVQLVMEHLALQPGDTIADFGCGMGYWESLLLTHGMEQVTVYGMDIDTFALSLAPDVMDWTFAFIDFYNAACRVMKADPETFLHRPENFSFIPFLLKENNTAPLTGKFDKVICMRTIHHLPQEAIQQMADLLKPGGEILILEHVAAKANKSKCADGGETTYYLTEKQILDRMEDAGCELLTAEMFNETGGIYLFGRK